MRRVLNSILAIGLCLTLGSAATAQDSPRVVVVHQVLHEFADRLLDGDAEVVFPVPDGVDPSFWRPSIADISTIQSADLIVLNGAGFAAWIDRVSLPRARVVNTSAALEDQFIATQSITHSHGDGGAHSHEGVASYTWLDPTMALAQAEAIATALIARDLARAEDVEPRLADLRSDLMDLDAAAQAALSDAQGVAMIATHPRYQYFARRYSLSVTSLEWDAGAAPTEDQLSELARLVEEHSAGVLIWEAEPLPEASAAAEAIGLKNVVFEPGARDRSDSTFIETYLRAVSDISDAVRHSSN